MTKKLETKRKKLLLVPEGEATQARRDEKSSDC
jgi:hypothetical protein